MNGAEEVESGRGRREAWGFEPEGGSSLGRSCPSPSWRGFVSDCGGIGPRPGLDLHCQEDGLRRGGGEGGADRGVGVKYKRWGRG